MKIHGITTPGHVVCSASFVVAQQALNSFLFIENRDDGVPAGFDPKRAGKQGEVGANAVHDLALNRVLQRHQRRERDLNRRSHRQISIRDNFEARFRVLQDYPRQLHLRQACKFG